MICQRPRYKRYQRSKGQVHVSIASQLHHTVLYNAQCLHNTPMQVTVSCTAQALSGATPTAYARAAS